MLPLPSGEAEAAKLSLLSQKRLLGTSLDATRRGCVSNRPHTHRVVQTLLADEGSALPPSPTSFSGEFLACTENPDD